jgi:flagellar basal body rod protein FlgG
MVEGDGRVMAGVDEVGQLELARFDKATLTREGDNLYAATAAPLAGGPPVEVMSGALEGANVNEVRGVVDLIKIQRSYESLMKMIQGYRDIDQAAARGLGKAK